MMRPLFVALSAAFLLLLPRPGYAAPASKKQQPTASQQPSSSTLGPTTAAPAGASNQKVIDGIAATVNGEVITYSQVRMLVGPRERMLRQQYRGPEFEQKMQEVHNAALQDLIDRALIVHAFKEVLGVDTLLLGLALPDCQAHAPNENFPIANFEAGIRLNQALFTELGS